ncbi:hypothetical protein [Persicitalea jodogahamensis]|uniref:Uncharacterized protein n=1 Tax=Persicitalea jodogahamensis TaxID=402147 RepID=A0A8J3G7H0_9BACT|nr:hypothetical protein [Persicitalea jodogahamensis]GHB51496.1 hypothetical protein GCM10007390_00060 [Persicitalea jodogahamensis]
MIRVLPLAFSFFLFLVLAGSAGAQVIPNVPQADTSLNNPDRDMVEPEKKPDQFGKNIADSIQTFAIRTGNVSYYSVCPGSRIMVPFTPQGPFNDDNVFSVQLVDVRGNFVAVSEGVKKGPIMATIPADKRGGHLYRLRVVSTSPAVVGSEVSLRLLPTPTARLESADGSTSSRIMPGQDAQLRVSFTGSGPWSFQLSDSTTITETVTNPYYLSTKLEKIKTYKLLGVSNACGSGSVEGSVIVNVDANPEPRLALKDPDKGYRVCTNTPFQVNFSATGAYKAGNNFLVQISDSKGAFKNITSGDTTAPIMARVPAGTPTGDYTLRIISTSPRLVSDSTRITIAAPTQTVLRRDSVKLKEGGSADLTLQFQGGGPWFVLLSDGTYENNILTSPYSIKVAPYNSTIYKITSAGGLCGVGTFSGSAYVAVDVPPSNIVMEKPSQTLICSGGEISVPFTTTGRFYAANKFIVQVSDSTGRYVDMPTTGKESPLKVKITPSSMRDTLSTHRIRIVATAPGVASEAQEIQVIAPDMAVGEVSGQGAITPGNSTRIRLKFKNGLPPWSFTLSDGSAVQGTFLNPYLISVSPKTTTDFTISSLKNACGTGTSRGSARVIVDN